VPAPAPTTAPTPGGAEPASFPHRRGKPSAADFTRFHERYSLHGKFLKYSAEIRNQGPSFVQDRRMQGPPPGSAYAVHAQLFARIEAVDALPQLHVRHVVQGHGGEQVPSRPVGHD